MGEQKRNGPSLKILARCDGCVHEHSEYYSIEDGNDVDSGSSVYCKHPKAEGRDAPDLGSCARRSIGDTTWVTPAWCPLLPAALAELNASAALVKL